MNRRYASLLVVGTSTRADRADETLAVVRDTIRRMAEEGPTEAELADYVAFWESPAGGHLNAALFTAFDAVFTQVFHDLGRATGLAMVGSDI